MLMLMKEQNYVKSAIAVYSQIYKIYIRATLQFTSRLLEVGMLITQAVRIFNEI